MPGAIILYNVFGLRRLNVFLLQTPAPANFSYALYPGIFSPHKFVIEKFTFLAKSTSSTKFW